MLLSIVLIILVVALDQVTKYLTVSNLDLGETFPVIKDVLHFTYVRNEGAAFGILAEHRWVFMVVSVIGIAALFVWLAVAKPESKWMRIGITFVVGGGIGNMIDRFVLGYVIDMIDCRFIDFYVFNAADSFVCIGCAMVILGLIAEIIRENRRKKTAEKAPADGAETDERD